MRETESSVWRESPAALSFRIPARRLPLRQQRRPIRLRQRLRRQRRQRRFPRLAAGEILESVTSPTVGIFYAAPAENAEPYVKAGDTVHKGDVLCIIEAMKLMNEVLAEKDGVIEAVCVQNGQVVEYGTELFKIKELSA